MGDNPKILVACWLSNHTMATDETPADSPRQVVAGTTAVVDPAA